MHQLIFPLLPVFLFLLSSCVIDSHRADNQAHAGVGTLAVTESRTVFRGRVGVSVPPKPSPCGYLPGLSMPTEWSSTEYKAVRCTAAAAGAGHVRERVRRGKLHTPTGA